MCFSVINYLNSNTIFLCYDEYDTTTSMNKPSGSHNLRVRVAKNLGDVKSPKVVSINVAKLKKQPTTDEKIAYLKDTISTQGILDGVTFEQWQKTGCL